MNQKDINAAVDYLYIHGAKYAEAKAQRVYLEEFRKSQKAMLMIAAKASGKAKSEAAAETEAPWPGLPPAGASGNRGRVIRQRGWPAPLPGRARA